MLIFAVFLMVSGSALVVVASCATGKRAHDRKAAARAAEAARPGTAVALAPKVILLEDVKFVPHARTSEGPHVEWVL